MVLPARPFICRSRKGRVAAEIHRLADEAFGDKIARSLFHPIIDLNESLIMSDIPNRETFESMYSASEKAPWDIGRPQPKFVEVADQVQGSVLDAGCGTGENALFFAQRGHAVLGIDFLEFPIQEAKRKAQERGVAAEFLRFDALTLSTLDRKFDSVIDSGLFHCFSDDDRKRYVAGLTHVTNPAGRLFLMCFSDEEPGTMGPRRVSQPELRTAFATGWTFETLRPVRFETNPDLKDFSFSEGGPKAWFAIVKKSP
jgi:2-polyprenyl-3-methyl-5-hydroxy-6-metoxy-1,4-benzoquinol methylase